jgi:hypothetical protein
LASYPLIKISSEGVITRKQRKIKEVDSPIPGPRQKLLTVRLVQSVARSPHIQANQPHSSPFFLFAVFNSSQIRPAFPFRCLVPARRLISFPIRASPVRKLPTPPAPHETRRKWAGRQATTGAAHTFSCSACRALHLLPAARIEGQRAGSAGR